MPRIDRRRSEHHVLLAALLVLAPAIGVAADEPEPTPAPTPVPGSLAAAAAGLKLQRSAEEGSALVITDQNLKAAGAGAAMSEGRGATVPPTAGTTSPPVATPAVTAPQANDFGSQLLAQQAKVDELEARLAAMDRQLAAPSADPHYPKTDSAPQFRAPGVVDPAQAERDALAAQLEAERARLDGLRAQGEKVGIQLRKVSNEPAAGAPPAGSPQGGQ